MAFAPLAVWMNGVRVGTWRWSRSGSALFDYEASWADSPYARPLSLSLPIPAGGGEIGGPAVENYFDNLLPDSGRTRERIQRRFGTRTAQAADLLAAVGRDCVGAVQLLPDNEIPPPHDRVECTPLTEADIERLLMQVPDDAPPGSSLLADFRISIAGMQEKTALLRIDDRWHIPHASTPTSHIFKLPLGLVGTMRADMRHSVENEWLCQHLLRLMGFAVAPAEIARFGAQKALVVERFDRSWADGGRWLVRHPQEDLCQATATPPERKYESDGGPGIRRCLQVLAGSQHAAEDRATFALAQLAFWLMAAIDGHAKNFSLHVGRGGTYRLTPLYDVLSAWPIIGNGPNQLSPRRAKLSMALRGKNVHSHLHEIHTRHFQALADQAGGSEVFDRMVAMVLLVPQVLGEAEADLDADFPRRVFDTIARGMTTQAQRFVQEL